MTDCLSTEVRDALPDVIHGNLDPAELARVEAHVASCAECAAELELLRTIMSSRPAAPPMDVQRIVSALPVAAKKGLLLHRGNGEHASESTSEIASSVRRSRSVWSRPALRIAAAVAVVAAGALSLVVGREVLNPELQVGRRIAPVAPAITPEIVPTSPAPASPAVARQVEPSSRSHPETVVASGLLMSEVQQLSDEHLVALLSEMDDMEAVPSTEPEAVAPALTESDTIGEG